MDRVADNRKAEAAERAEDLSQWDAIDYVADRLVADGLAVRAQVTEFWLGAPSRFDSGGQYFAKDPSDEHWVLNGPYHKRPERP